MVRDQFEQNWRIIVQWIGKEILAERTVKIQVACVGNFCLQQYCFLEDSPHGSASFDCGI